MSPRLTFAKLVVLVLAMGLFGASLLSIRQRRLQAISDMTEAQRRVLSHDRTLWKLRAEIASRVQPERVRTIVDRAEGSFSLDAGAAEAIPPRRLAYLGEPAPGEPVEEGSR